MHRPHQHHCLLQFPRNPAGSGKDIIMDSILKNSDQLKSMRNLGAAGSLQHQQTQNWDVDEQRRQQVSAATDSHSEFPGWAALPLDPHMLPDLYMDIWRHVRSAVCPSLCDVHKLHPILLTSGIPSEVLASIWSFVNRAVPGQLTAQELFVALSMIAMAQSAAPFIASHVVHQSRPQIPILKQTRTLPADEFADFQSHTKACNDGAATDGCLSSSDDFDDFVTASDGVLPSETPADPGSDRYDVFRDLDSCASDQKLANGSHDDHNDRILIWKKCLSTCKQLFQKSFNALIVNHGEESAIEALRSEPGSLFIRDLHQIHSIARRIGIASRALNTISSELHGLLADIEMTWRPLHLLFNKVIDSKEAAHVLSQEHPHGKCYICMSREPAEPVIVDAIYYHKSCANLWVSCVHSRLPTPLSQ